MDQLALFDYQQLDTETASDLQGKAERIRGRVVNIAVNVWHIGEELAEAQKRLARDGYGCFIQWAESETGLSYRSVYRMINVYKSFDSDTVSESKIATTALYQLSAESTPQSARDEATYRAEQGENITNSTAKEIIDEHKQQGQESEAETPPMFEYAESVEDSEPEPQDEQDNETEETQEQSDKEEKPNGRQKPKKSQPANTEKPSGFDHCQTPPYAVEPLIKYLPDSIIWEPANADGYLSGALADNGCQIVTSQIEDGQNFFDYEPENWQVQVTNPPYSIKYKWLERSYELGKPFALLLPVETLAAQSGQALFKEYGVEIIILSSRVDFHMPEKGWDGKGSQFPTAWFTWGLNLGQQIIFEDMNKVKMNG